MEKISNCVLPDKYHAVILPRWGSPNHNLITVWPKAYHLCLILTQQWVVWERLIYNTRQCESFIVEIKTESSPSAVLSLFKLTLFSFCTTFKLVFQIIHKPCSHTVEPLLFSRRLVWKTSLFVVKDDESLPPFCLALSLWLNFSVFFGDFVTFCSYLQSRCHL